jgi:hypothetical protein
MDIGPGIVGYRFGPWVYPRAKPCKCVSPHVPALDGDDGWVFTCCACGAQWKPRDVEVS